MTTQDRVRELRNLIREFLDDEILAKSPDERTERDDLLLEAGQHFVGLLIRHKSQLKSSAFDKQMADLMHSHRKLMEDNDAVAITEERK